MYGMVPGGKGRERKIIERKALGLEAQITFKWAETAPQERDPCQTRYLPLINATIWHSDPQILLSTLH